MGWGEAHFGLRLQERLAMFAKSGGLLLVGCLVGSGWIGKAMAFRADIQTLSPSQFSDFIHFFRAKSLSFDSTDAATTSIISMFSAWAKQQGYARVQVQVEPAEIQRAGDRVFFKLSVLRFRHMKIKAVHVEMESESEQPASLIPPFPALAGQEYDSLQIGRVLQAYLDLLRESGFLFAKAQVSQTSFGDDGVSLRLNIQPGKRFEFRLHQVRQLNPRVLREKLTTKLQRDFPMDELAEGVTGIYHEHGFVDFTIVDRQTYFVPETGSHVFELRVEEGIQYLFQNPSLISSKGPEDKPLGIQTFLGTFFQEFPEHRYYSGLASEAYMKHLTESLKDLGYYRSAVSLKKTEIFKETGFIKPTYEVQLGQQGILRSLELHTLREENEPDPLSDLLKVWEESSRVWIHKPLSKTQINKAFQDLKDTWVSQGYLDFQYSLDIAQETDPLNLDRMLVDMKVIQNPGRRYFFEGHEFLNTCETEESLLLLYMDLPKPGSPYPFAQIEKSISNLYISGLVRSVDVEYRDRIEGEQVFRSAVIELQCSPRGNHEMGAGLYTESGVRVFSRVGYRNFLRMNRSISFYSAFGVQDPSRFSVFETDFRLDMLWPFIFYSPFDAKFSSQFSVVDDLDFDTSEARFGLLLEKNLLPWLTVGLDIYQFSFNFQFHFRNDLLKKEYSQLGRTGVTLSLNFADHPTAPTQGHQHDLSAHITPPALGSSAHINFYRLASSHTVYLSPAEANRFVLALMASFGWNQTMGPNDYIPRSRFFYLGGEESVRGFDAKSIGLAGQVDPRTIRSMFSVNLRSELRFRLVEGLYLFGFLDQGRIWSNRLALTPLRSGAGGGFRLQTPLGGINLAIGLPIDGFGPPPNQVRKFQDFKIHLSLSTF
jgi:outer membrane protein assembly factor BamA